MVELASDDRGRRTREGKESAAHVCSAIRAAQTVGWTPLVVGARSPCCRSVLFVITADILFLLKLAAKNLVQASFRPKIEYVCIYKPL